MDLPEELVAAVRDHRAVLFLGAGATVGATVGAGGKPPVGDELKDRIAQHFLSGAHTDCSLATVSEYAIANTSLFEVQDFVAAQFADLEPAVFHNLMPTFGWRGIATTNYDQLVEIVYRRAQNGVNEVVPFLSNDDHVDEKLRDNSAIGLLKLHGCVTRTNDRAIPLILTHDQYVSFRANRSRLFEMLKEWGSENPIIFIGHRVQDPNLREVLLELDRDVKSRPLYFLVRPGISDIEVRFWDTKRVAALAGSFEELLNELDSQIDKQTRVLIPDVAIEHSIRRRFIVHSEPSQLLIDMLHAEFEYIDESLPVEAADPKHFYRGGAHGWYPILNDLDVRRGLTDTILEEVVLRPEEDRPTVAELYLIRAEAGAGKSTMLRRLAWEGGTRAGALCLRFTGVSLRSFEPIRELADSTGERIFAFVDNAAQHAGFIRDLIFFAKKRKVRVTVITTERTNEWNIACEFLEGDLTGVFPMRYLKRPEIEQLVELLEKHDSLGPNLSEKSRDERIRELEERAGRQLLVALHEATLGKPFEDILVDEYQNIAPAQAQTLYLTVCALNRLKIPVRAGLISRIHEIPFEEFKNRLFKPLEHVVQVVRLPWGDFAYQARHSEIARLVFERVLEDATERYNTYVRILRALNPMYSTDESAFREMIRGKSIHVLFPSHEDATEIYKIVEKIMPDDAYVLQQRGNYERIRPNGNLRLAEDYLRRARELEPRDSTIAHTLAEVLRAKAEESSRPLERVRYRAEARAALRDIRPGSSGYTYATVTTLKLVTDEIRDLFHDEEATDTQIDEAIRDAERQFDIARQRYPGERFVLTAEAEFAEVLRDDARTLRALETARRANPRDPFIASRLAKLLVAKGDEAKALEYVEQALDGNPGDKRLNFQYAELLRLTGCYDRDKLLYYYRRSRTSGDDNYDSQFWYARFLFESTDEKEVEEAKRAFRDLRGIYVSFEEKRRIRDAIGGLEDPRLFRGTVGRVEATHGFVVVDGRGDQLFFHEHDMEPEVWNNLKSGARLKFGIGFALLGVQAIHLVPE